jgi:hypothetical protein
MRILKLIYSDKILDIRVISMLIRGNEATKQFLKKQKLLLIYFVVVNKIENFFY